MPILLWWIGLSVLFWRDFQIAWNILVSCSFVAIYLSFSFVVILCPCMNTGHLKGCRWSNCCIWLVHAKSAMGTKPSCDLGVMFLILFAIFRAYGHLWGVIASGHWRVACSIMILDLSCKSRIHFSALPFWWWTLTPQYVIVLPCSFTWLMNTLSANLPLSAWYCSISTPAFLAYC